VSLRDLSLKRAYSSDTDEIVREFYIPVLQASVEYRRLAGFFSSASLAVAARGILGLIGNGGTMRLIACPKLTKDDIRAIGRAEENPSEYLQESLLRDLSDLPNGFVRDHVAALGWMVAKGLLDIRLCVPCDETGRLLDQGSVAEAGMFHQKVGILMDAERNCVSFSGSVNETASGWLGNIEEFKVFRSWQPLEREYQKADIAKFQRFWDGTSPRVRTFAVPDAVRQKLVDLAPDSIERAAIRSWYRGEPHPRRRSIELFDYQKEAVRAWVENGYRGIFEMATGTGKTFTALGCLEEAFGAGLTAGVVIATPYQHLSQQWLGEIKKYGLDHGEVVVADSSRPGWKDRLADCLMDLSMGYDDRLIVLTTHATLSSADFATVLAECRGNSHMLLVADEVHGLGAEKARTRLSDAYDLRLGLSATPHRWFDTRGTKSLVDYFGGVVYEFPLDRAINTLNPATGTTFLAPYRYLPRFVSLGSDELSEYVRKTQALFYATGGKPPEELEDPKVERLLFARANIIKNARAKYDALDKILDELGNGLRWTIIYCSPQQIDEVVRILNDRSISLHRFTMDEGTTPRDEFGGVSEREYLLDRFAEGDYQALVAMRCLDEGVDVPPARTGILMCSSGNPREYVQRIGRLVRRYEGKRAAIVYDIIVAPSVGSLPSEMRAFERRIFEKELRRCKRIAEVAENSTEVLKLLDEAMSNSL